MTIWETIIEAQAKKQSQTKCLENGQEVQIVIEQNGWYEGFVSMA